MNHNQPPSPSVKNRAFTLIKLLVLGAAVAGTSLSVPAHADPPGGTSGWTKTFGDEFSGSSLDSTKWIKTFYWGDGLIQSDNCYYDPNNVSIASDLLNLQCTFNGSNGKQRTGGVVETYGKFAQTYGYYEASIHNARGGPGTGYSWYLLSADTAWPPEIDIMEAPGIYNNGRAYFTNHYLDSSNNPQSVYNYYAIDTTNGYHTYGVDWEPGVITWYVDGVQQWSTTTGVPSKPMYLVFQHSASDDTTYNGTANSTTVWPNTEQVDWVRVWQKNAPVTTTTPNANTYYQLINRWTSGGINVQNGFTCGAVQPTWWSADWSFVPNGSYYRIVNRYTGAVINTDNGLQCTTNVPTTHWGADWSLQTNGSYVRLVNRWTGGVLNTDNGFQCTTNVPTTHWGADWSLQVAQ